MSEDVRTVLITGCSSGIGLATARTLAESGFRVLATVRNEDQVDSLRDPALPLLEPVLMDVTSEDDVLRTVEYIKQTCPQGLYALVNNAGAGLPAAVELSSIDEVRGLFEVNTLGPLRMIQRCLPALRLGGGRILNISSMNGTIALPMVGAYSATKYALEALSDTLRVELRPWRIPVVIIRPGQIRTSIFAKARESLNARRQGIPAELRNGYDVMYARAGKFNERGAKSRTAPEDVAKVVLKALEAKRPRTHYWVGFDALGMQLAKAGTPRRLLDRILARVIGALKPVKHDPPTPSADVAPSVPIEPTVVSQ